MPALVDQTAIVGPLSAADLDRETNPGAVLLPAGCDQQGRYPTRVWAAEACTEVGQDDADPRASATFWAVYAVFVVVAVASAVAYFYR